MFRPYQEKQYLPPLAYNFRHPHTYHAAPIYSPNSGNSHHKGKCLVKFRHNLNRKQQTFRTSRHMDSHTMRHNGYSLSKHRSLPPHNWPSFQCNQPGIPPPESDSRPCRRSAPEVRFPIQPLFPHLRFYQNSRLMCAHAPPAYNLRRFHIDNKLPYVHEPRLLLPAILTLHLLSSPTFHLRHRLLSLKLHRQFPQLSLRPVRKSILPLWYNKIHRAHVLPYRNMSFFP